MKLLLCNDKKIKSYNLTNGNEDGLIIDYYDDSDIYETISIKKVDNSWSVENKVNIEIVGNKNICDLYEKKDIHFLSINKIIWTEISSVNCNGSFVVFLHKVCIYSFLCKHRVSFPTEFALNSQVSL